MSVNWSWKEKVGYIEFSKPYKSTTSLYSGNCMLIAITEWKQEDEETGEEKEMYNLFSFFSDKEHGKRCLGLLKGYDCLWADMNIKALHLFTNNQDWAELSKLFTRALEKGLIDFPVIIEKGENNG